MEAGKRSINDIFNGNKILEIPFYQRAYVWDTPQWERFLADMEYVSHNNTPYFLGSIILKQQMTDSQQSVGDKRTVIDGQQRLTTLAIFFKVLSLKIQDPYPSNLFRLPMQKHEIALLHNHNDVTAFNRVLNLSEESTLPEEDSVTLAYTYFAENIDIEKLNYRTILNNIMFVGIDLGVNEDEQQIFDTINSLGVKLTTAELLKNYFFGRDDIQLYKDYWQNVFEKDAETKEFWDTEILAGRLRRYFIDLFFYSFLQIKIQDSALNVSAEDKDEFMKVEGLFESYKKFIKKYAVDKFLLIEEIKGYSNIFRHNFDAEVIDRDLSDSNSAERINALIFGLENTTLIPYVLFILKNVPDEQERSKIFSYLESYIMRRMVCHASTKNYNRLFSEQLISNNILTKDDLKIYIDKRSDKVNYIPSDSDLRKGFHESKLINKQTAGILYLIESKIRNRAKHSTALLGLKHYSLEHLMPKKWENHWGTLEHEQARAVRNKTLLTLGNLTIITGALNSSIRDEGWNVKLNGKGSYGGLKRYAAGLDTFDACLNLPIWDEKAIEQRADFLYGEAVKIWADV